MPGSCSRSEDASQVASPRFKVAGWGVDGQSTDGCTGELMGGGCYNQLFLAFYLYRHHNKEVLTIGNFILSEKLSGVGGS